jgi:hypothetical protein
VSDSLHLRRFCLLPLTQRVPEESTVRKLARRLGPETVNELTRVVIGKARRETRFAARVVRIDSTVVEADIRYPTDGGLAWQGARALAREGRKLAGRVPGQTRRVVDRSRQLGRTVRAISPTLARRTGQRRDEVMELNTGYGSGEHAPGRADTGDAIRAAHHLNLGHGLAVQALRAAGRLVRVGVTLLLTDVEAASDRDEDIVAARRLDGAGNRLFLDPVLRGEYPADMLEHYAPTGGFDVVRDGDLKTIQAPLDALGVNHYHHRVVTADPDDPKLGIRVLPVEGPTTSYGWGYTPESLRRVLVRVSDEYTKLPVYVTESGASLHDYVDPEGRVNDVERIDYLSRYFGAAAQAVSEGVDLRGYFVWSLFDNFEWQHGYSMRFGLFYVEFSSQRRIPKASAHWYRQFITAASRTTPA